MRFPWKPLRVLNSRNATGERRSRRGKAVTERKARCPKSRALGGGEGSDRGAEPSRRLGRPRRSAKQDGGLEHYLGASWSRRCDRVLTTSEDVEQTKPEPDLVLAAVEKAGWQGRSDAGRFDSGTSRPRSRPALTRWLS